MSDEARIRINMQSGAAGELAHAALGIDWYDTESQARRVAEYAAAQIALLTFNRDHHAACNKSMHADLVSLRAALASIVAQDDIAFAEEGYREGFANVVRIARKALAAPPPAPAPEHGCNHERTRLDAGADRASGRGRARNRPATGSTGTSGEASRGRQRTSGPHAARPGNVGRLPVLQPLAGCQPVPDGASRKWLLRGSHMSREVPFDENAYCDLCNTKGAYDFMGDQLCEACGTAALEPWEVTCARCGKVGTSATFEVEEGDEWECPECWERCEAQERARTP